MKIINGPNRLCATNVDILAHVDKATNALNAVCPSTNKTLPPNIAAMWSILVTRGEIINHLFNYRLGPVFI